MMTTKAWYLSRAIWGGIASIASGLGMLFGVEIDPEQLTDAFIEVSGPVSALIGGAVAVWGRAAARDQITGS